MMRTLIECYYIFTNFHLIKQFVLSLSDNQELQDLLQMANIFEELKQIASHRYIICAIKYLKFSKLSLEEQISEINAVLDGLTDERLKIRFISIIEKTQTNFIQDMCGNEELIRKLKLSYLLL